MIGVLRNGWASITAMTAPPLSSHVSMWRTRGGATRASTRALGAHGASLTKNAAAPSTDARGAIGGADRGPLIGADRGQMPQAEPPAPRSRANSRRLPVRRRVVGGPACHEHTFQRNFDDEND